MKIGDEVYVHGYIDEIRQDTVIIRNGGGYFGTIPSEVITEELPSEQPDYQEVLGWLLAYHTKSFDLHGRYLPHEVISWLINDFTEEFIAERRTDESD